MSGATGYAIAYLIVAIVSVAYNYQQAQEQKKRFKQMQEDAERRADQAKGFQIVTEAEAAPLYVPYGRCIAGGVRVYHKISSALSMVDPGTNGTKFWNLGSYSGSKNELMIFQQAISFGPINRVLTVDVDDVLWNDAQHKNGVNITVFPNGSYADPTITAFDGDRVNSTFTDIAYATCVFKMDREEPQFSGVPTVKFYIEGVKVPVIVDNAGVKSIGAYSYSNNPARCLLDYLTNTRYGKGLDVSYIDLDSFYVAQQICEKVVLTNQTKAGKHWNNSGLQRDVKRFECNVALSSENTIRDNIERILESMDMSELIWTGGKYKLSLKYPTVYSNAITYGLGDVVQHTSGSINLYRSLTDNNNGVIGGATWAADVAPYITDDDLIKDADYAVMWPNAKERYNKFSVKFRNESKDFQEDTVSWPSADSPVYTTFLTEDSNQILEGDNYEETITDYWHALARAEQRCRFSRISANYKFKLTSKWAKLEPGDLVFVSSDLLQTQNALLRVTEAEITDTGLISISATRYDAAVLAWNAVDSEYVGVSAALVDVLDQASNLRFVNDNRIASYSAGSLFWDPSLDSRIKRYIVYATRALPEQISDSTEWEELGTTSNTSFAIPSIPAGYYTLAVAGSTASGKLTRRWSNVTTERWPTISVGVGALVSGSTTQIAVSVYKRSATAPAAPSDGSYNFSTLQWTSLPTGWTIGIPAGAQPLYRADAVISSIDTVYTWNAPQLVNNADTRIEVTKPVLPVYSNNGVNSGYAAANGAFVVYLNNLNVTLDAGTSFVLTTQYNCDAVVSNVGGTKGNYSVTSLNGSSGYFTVAITFGGTTFYRTISVNSIETGYQYDSTPPATPTGITVTVGLNTVFVELAALPSYTEGHGHLRTEIYGWYGVPGSGTSAQAELIDYFEGTMTAFPSRLNTPLQIWIGFRSQDNVLSPLAGGVNGFDATTGKIATGDIATKAITRALIGDAAIDSLQVADGAIVNAKIGQVIQSTTYNQGTSGWMIDKNGSAVFNNLTIYDGAGNIVMSSGAGVSWGKVSGANRPADNATRNVFKGAWASGVAYDIGDVVLVSGSSWSALAQHTSSGTNQPPTLPTTSNSWWTLAAQRGADGATTEMLYLDTSDVVISKSSANVMSPSTVTVYGKSKTSTSAPISYSGRFKIYENGSGTASYTSAANESSKAYSVTSTVTSLKVELYQTGGTTVLLDTLTIPVVNEGSSAVTGLLSNESSTVPADVAGVVSSLTGTGTLIMCWEGASQLSYAASNPAIGQFTIGTPVVSPAGKITVGAISLSGSNASVANHTSMATDTDVVTITFPISGKRMNGTTFSFDKVQNITKSKTGATGAPGATGANAIQALLSNESHAVPTDNAGNNGNYTGCATTVSVYIGATDDSANWSATFTPGSGVSGSPSGKTYTVTDMTVDTGYVDVVCARNGYSNLTKRFSIVKAKAGIDGSASSAELLNLAVDSQAFTFTDGAANPGSQTVTFTANLVNMTGTVVWSSSPAVTLTGTGNTRSLDLAGFGSNRQVTVTASLNGQSDSITVIRLERSTAAAGATVGANSSNLNIGNTINLLPNSDFTLTATGWAVTWTQNAGQTTSFARNLAGTNWTAYGTNQIGIVRTGTISGVVDFGFTPRVVVKASTRYEFTAYRASHRCDTQLCVAWYDVNGTYISEAGTSFTTSGNRAAGGTSLSGWKLETLFATSPSNAYYGMPYVRTGANDSGTDCYSWLCRPLFGEALAAQTVGSGYNQYAVPEQITPANASTFIAAAAITNALIGDVIQSNSYVANTSGWKIDKTGNIELNSAIFRGTIDVKSAQSGARLVIKSNVIGVYDAGGILRVKLGDLSASV